MDTRGQIARDIQVVIRPKYQRKRKPKPLGAGSEDAHECAVGGVFEHLVRVEVGDVGVSIRVQREPGGIAEWWAHIELSLRVAGVACIA